MIGPPGSGKTMLAKRIPSILPEMSFAEALETTAVHSVCGFLGNGAQFVGHRPFRAPHHTISGPGLVGGGSQPRPGEVSLAHNGVLFLDELTEFNRSVLEVLRQPLEDREITISRALRSLTFPAGFMLAAAMNPCPCGYRNSVVKDCLCSPLQVQRYISKISGPLLDRIDLHIDVPEVNYRDLSGRADGEPSAAIAARIRVARQIQELRFAACHEGRSSNGFESHHEDECVSAAGDSPDPHGPSGSNRHSSSIQAVGAVAVPLAHPARGTDPGGRKLPIRFPISDQPSLSAWRVFLGLTSIRAERQIVPTRRILRFAVLPPNGNGSGNSRESGSRLRPSVAGDCRFSGLEATPSPRLNRAVFNEFP
jgi:hypothetical protein